MSVGFLPSALRGVTLTTSGRLPDGHLRVSRSADTDGLLVGLDDGDDAFLVSGKGLAGVLRRDLVDDFPRGVALEPFGDPAADDDRLEWVVSGCQGQRDPWVAAQVAGFARARTG